MTAPRTAKEASADATAEGGILGSILLVRGQRVVLDATLADLYGVTTRRLNEQVRRNRRRFPEDFLLDLTARELENLKSHFGDG